MSAINRGKTLFTRDSGAEISKNFNALALSFLETAEKQTGRTGHFEKF